MHLSCKITYLLFFLLCNRLCVRAQHAVFVSEGKIEFEKKINLYAQTEGEGDDDSWAELRKKSMPKFKTTYFDLTFTSNKTLYKPGRENTDNNKLWEMPAEQNVVYTDLENERAVSQKKIFEQSFLVQDSTRKIKWKITDETRTIAGFPCRRANAIIMDSIYVVAFYTDEIIASGGPESFSGLPGMILGIALPHQHITWFATKVQAVPVNATELAAPAKGKKVNNSGLKETLERIAQQWGKFGRRFLEAAML